MTIQATTRIPLCRAFYCLNCECVCDSAVECECGSTALLSMSAVLNREPEDVEAIAIEVLP